MGKLFKQIVCQCMQYKDNNSDRKSFLSLKHSISLQCIFHFFLSVCFHILQCQSLSASIFSLCHPNFWCHTPFVVLSSSCATTPLFVLSLISVLSPFICYPVLVPGRLPYILCHLFTFSVLFHRIWHHALSLCYPPPLPPFPLCIGNCCSPMTVHIW